MQNLVIDMFITAINYVCLIPIIKCYCTNENLMKLLGRDLQILWSNVPTRDQLPSEVPSRFAVVFVPMAICPAIVFK